MDAVQCKFRFEQLHFLYKIHMLNSFKVLCRIALLLSVTLLMFAVSESLSIQDHNFHDRMAEWIYGLL